MELISERKKGIPLMLEWVKTNLSLTTTANFSREQVSEQTRVTPAIVSRVFLVLMNKGYLSYKQHRNVPGVYRLLKEVSFLTTEQVDLWIKEYQQGKDRDRKAKLGEEEPVLPQPQPSVFDQPTESNGYRFESTSTQAPVEAPKSRSQQLLEEARRLQQLAEEELQREAMEQEKANQPVDEQPGTLPELLTMLDTRIDGVERRFDALDRKFDLLERRVNTVLYFFQQASFAVRGLSPVSLPVEPVSESVPTAETAPVEPTTRMLLVRLVNSYAAADRKTEHDTWKWLYGQFDLRKGFNVYAQAGPLAKGKDESYLALIEQHGGHIKELYRLARKLMVLPELK